MSESANVEVVKRMYAAVRNGVESALPLFTEDVTFTVPGPPGIGAAGVWRGHAGVRACFETVTRTQETTSLEVREFVAQGHRVVVLLHAFARVRATGRTFESDIVHIFTVDNGRISALEDFFDTAALADAVRT